jgi:hypothetical protein
LKPIGVQVWGVSDVQTLLSRYCMEVNHERSTDFFVCPVEFLAVVFTADG